MQEETVLQQSEGNKVTTTFKCSPSTRAKMLAKAAQLDISLSALCEDYILAGLNGQAATSPSAAPQPDEKPERTLTDTDLELIRIKQEQAFMNVEQARREEEAAKQEKKEPQAQEEPQEPVLALRLTLEQRELCDQVNEHRQEKNLPLLEDSAADILSGYAADSYERMRFEKMHGLKFDTFKKALKESAKTL